MRASFCQLFLHKDPFTLCGAHRRSLMTMPCPLPLNDVRHFACLIASPSTPAFLPSLLFHSLSHSFPPSRCVLPVPEMDVGDDDLSCREENSTLPGLDLYGGGLYGLYLNSQAMDVDKEVLFKELLEPYSVSAFGE